MIEVQDCDARLPSSGDAADLYLDQLVRLSVIVGRVQKNIYTYVRFPRTAFPQRPFILTTTPSLLFYFSFRPLSATHPFVFVRLPPPPSRSADRPASL